MVLLYLTLLNNLTLSIEEKGDMFWRVAIDKEINNILGMVTFEMMEVVKPEDIQFQKHNMPGYI